MKNRKGNTKAVYSTKEQSTSESWKYLTMLRSLLICFIMAFVMIMVYALLLSFSSISDASMSKVTQTILIISVALSSAYGGKEIGERGWLFGALLGLIFALLLIPFGMAFGQVLALDMYLMAKLLVSAVVGAIGGIIGVNLN
jgi:putative membrane protein (TIGR04086 family)